MLLETPVRRYLAMFIHQLITEQYTIFVIRGDLPKPKFTFSPQGAPPPPSSFGGTAHTLGGAGNSNSSMDSSMHDDIQRAIQMSLLDQQPGAAQKGTNPHPGQ